MAVLSLNRCAGYLQRWIVSLKGYMSIIPEVTPVIGLPGHRPDSARAVMHIRQSDSSSQGLTDCAFDDAPPVGLGSY